MHGYVDVKFVFVSICWQFSFDNTTGWSFPRLRWVMGMLKFYTLTLQQYWSMAATKD